MIYVLIVSQFFQNFHIQNLDYHFRFDFYTNIYGLLCKCKPISYQQKCQYNFHRTYLEHLYFSNFRGHLNFDALVIFSFVNKFSPPGGHYVLSNQPIADRVRFYSFIVLFRGQVDSQFQVFCLLSYPLYSKPL